MPAGYSVYLTTNSGGCKGKRHFFPEKRARTFFSVILQGTSAMMKLQSGGRVTTAAVRQEVPKRMPVRAGMAVAIATGFNSPPIAGSNPAV